MNTDLQQWSEAKRVFDRLAHVPAERRHERLERMAISTQTRERVLQLFAAHDRVDGVLDRPSPLNPGPDSLAGRQLGPWILQAELGRGGSAVVYRARSSSNGTERVAALKLLTLGSLARSGMERFGQEQRILARLHHPHIAPLFDVGQAEDGTPWLAMALIEGVPIDAWCQTHAYLPRQTVALFLHVCDAVAYAHRNLVIHRDIKPSNVLVDQDGHVHLLDFGIARLLDDTGAATQTQWRMLTPQYAAPEQFDGALPSTAMDVFGLGALLYRLLSGSVPRQLSASTDQLPQAPSELVENASALRRELRGDLDRIVLKALALRPEDRYASVSDLAADLRHWLAGEPVSATPPRLAYRLRKFIARNRLVVGAAAALFVALVGGIVATTWQAQRAEQQAMRAQAVKNFVTSLFSDAGPGTYAAGGTATDIREALARGAERARSELADTPDVEAELLLLIGGLQSDYGQYPQARHQLEDALILTERNPTARDQHGEVLEVLAGLARRENKFADAIRQLDVAIAELSELHEDKWLFNAYTERAGANQLLGRLDAAFADFDQAGALEATLPPQPTRRKEHLIFGARLQIAAGRHRDAYATLSAARAIVPDQPLDFVLYELLGEAAQTIERWSEAEDSYRHAVDLVRRGYPEGSVVLAQPYSYLATFLRRIGRLEEAGQVSRAALEAQSTGLSADNPALANTNNNVGVVMRDLGRYAEALAYLRRAATMGDAAYGAANPVPAITVGHIALTLAEIGDIPFAQQAIAAANARLVDAQTNGIKGPKAYANAYTNLARTALVLELPATALAFIDAAESVDSSEMPSVHPTVVDRVALRVKALLLAQRTYEAGTIARALEQRLIHLGPDQPFFERAETLAILARAALARGDYASAARLARDAVQRNSNVQYPQFVEAELSALAREIKPPAAL